MEDLPSALQAKGVEVDRAAARVGAAAFIILTIVACCLEMLEICMEIWK